MTQPKYLKLETNRPEQIQLRYPTARECDGFSGKQLRWILMDGRALYTPLIVAERVACLKLKPGERFTIKKHQVGDKTDWQVSKAQPISKLLDQSEDIDKPQLTGTPSNNGTVGEQHPSKSVTRIVTSVPATQLATALKMAISAAADAAGISRRYGGIHFEQGDLMGRTLGRQVGQQAWEVAIAHINGISI